MRHVICTLLVWVGLLVAASLARASDASLKRALTPYTARLTADVGCLSSFSVPNPGSAGRVLKRLVDIPGDLSGVTERT